MNDYSLYKDPAFSLQGNHKCVQAPILKNIEIGWARLDEKLENQNLILLRMADNIDQIKILTERDSRREKDVQELLGRVWSLETDCRKEEEIKRLSDELNKMDKKLEVLVIKVGAVIGIIVLVGSVIINKIFIGV